MGSARKRRHTGVGFIAAVAGLSLAAGAVAFSLAVRWLGLEPAGDRGRVSCQIEVLNGSGASGIAMEVALELRRSGVDVLIVDNAERSDFARSVLVDRRGNPKLMRRLAGVLGRPMVVTQVKPRPLVDATYIIGRDRLAAVEGRRP